MLMHVLQAPEAHVLHAARYLNFESHVCRRPGILVLVNDVDWELRCSTYCLLCPIMTTIYVCCNIVADIGRSL